MKRHLQKRPADSLSYRSEFLDMRDQTLVDTPSQIIVTQCDPPPIHLDGANAVEILASAALR